MAAGMDEQPETLQGIIKSVMDGQCLSGRKQRKLLAAFAPQTIPLLAGQLEQGLLNPIDVDDSFRIYLRTKDPTFLNNLALLPYEGPFADNVTVIASHWQAVNGLNVPFRHVNDLSRADAECVAGYRAVVKVLLASGLGENRSLYRSGNNSADHGNSLYFTDPEVEAFVARNHQQTEQVAALLGSGRRFDSEFFQQVLDGAEPALIEGQL